MATDASAVPPNNPPLWAYPPVAAAPPTSAIVTVSLAPVEGIPDSTVQMAVSVTKEATNGDALTIAAWMRQLVEDVFPDEWLLRVCAPASTLTDDPLKAVRLLYGNGVETLVLFGTALEKDHRTNSVPHVSVRLRMALPGTPQQPDAKEIANLPILSPFDVALDHMASTTSSKRVYITTQAGGLRMAQQLILKRTLRVQPSEQDPLALVGLKDLQRKRLPTVQASSPNKKRPPSSSTTVAETPIVSTIARPNKRHRVWNPRKIRPYTTPPRGFIPLTFTSEEMAQLAVAHQTVPYPPSQQPKTKATPTRTVPTHQLMSPPPPAATTPKMTQATNEIAQAVDEANQEGAVEAMAEVVVEEPVVVTSPSGTAAKPKKKPKAKRQNNTPSAKTTAQKTTPRASKSGKEKSSNKSVSKRIRSPPKKLIESMG